MEEGLEIIQVMVRPFTVKTDGTYVKIEGDKI